MTGNPGGQQRNSGTTYCAHCGKPLRWVRLRAHVILCKGCYGTGYYSSRRPQRVGESLLEQAQDAQLVA